MSEVKDIWGENATHRRADWKYEVCNGDTNLGYWDGCQDCPKHWYALCGYVPEWWKF